MTHTEAADLILRASGSGLYGTTVTMQADILAAVATVMDAARADAHTPCQLNAKVVARVQADMKLAEDRNHLHCTLRLSDVQAMLAALSVPIAT